MSDTSKKSDFELGRDSAGGIEPSDVQIDVEDPDSPNQLQAASNSQPGAEDEPTQFKALDELCQWLSVNVKRYEGMTIGKLSSLRELDLSGCSQLQELRESIVKLGSLTKLDLLGCSQLQRLPESIGQLSSLERLNLSFCGQLQRLPESIGQLSSLRELNLSFCSQLQQLPESMSRLRNLDWFDLNGCPRLQTLPDLSASDISKREGLMLWGCDDLLQVHVDELPLALQPFYAKRAAVLARQEEALKEAVSAVSWLSVLLATSCFVGSWSGPDDLGDDGLVDFGRTNLNAKHAYFICNTLTFFVAFATTVFAITQSLPNQHVESSTDLPSTLRVGSILLVLMAIGGTCTFLSGALAVYPSDSRTKDIVIPAACAGFFLCISLLHHVWRVHRFLSWLSGTESYIPDAKLELLSPESRMLKKLLRVLQAKKQPPELA